MGWHDLPATNATDWSTPEFLNQFRGALRERYIAAGGDPNGVPDLNVGDDVQSASLISGMQGLVLDLASHFCPPDLIDTYPEIDNLTGCWAQAELLAAAGIPNSGERTLSPTDPIQAGRPGWLARHTVTGQIWEYKVDDYILTTYGYSHAYWHQAEDQGLAPDSVPTGFTRKYPREIDLAFDPDWPGDDGDVARGVFDNRIYEHVSGAWVLAEDQTQEPDLVVAYGMCQYGDYIGPWIWNELQAAINKLTTRQIVNPNANHDGLDVSSRLYTWWTTSTGSYNWVGTDAPPFTPELMWRGGSSSSWNTTTVCRAEAIANFVEDTSKNGGLWTRGLEWHHGYDHYYFVASIDPGNYPDPRCLYAEATRYAGHAALQLPDPGVPRHVKTYIWVLNANGDAAGGSPPPDLSPPEHYVFNDLGTGVLPHRWNLKWVFDAGSGTIIKSPTTWPDNPGTVPAQPWAELPDWDTYATHWYFGVNYFAGWIGPYMAAQVDYEFEYLD